MGQNGSLDRAVRLMQEDERIAVSVFDDPPEALFHPKAHASRAGRETRLMLGSANLTGAAIARNYELAGIVADTSAFEKFREAVRDLCAQQRVYRLHPANWTSLRADLLARWQRMRGSTPYRESPGVGTLPAGRQLTLSPQLDLSLPPAESLPAVGSAEQARLWVQEIARVGHLVHRFDQEIERKVPIYLKDFYGAKILSGSEGMSLGRSGTLEGHASNILVRLIPDDLEESLTEVNRRHGALIGNLGLSMAGVSCCWMPSAWVLAFRARWQRYSVGEEAAVESRIRAHVESLPGEWAGEEILRQLMNLPINAPSQWDWDRCPGLLSWSDRHLTTVTVDVRRAVAESVRTRVQALLADNRLQADFAVTEVLRSGWVPAFEEVSEVSVARALGVLADWTRVGAQAGPLRAGARPPGDSARRRRPRPASTVAGVWAQAFRRGQHSGLRAYTKALGWQRTLSEGEPPIELVLVEAVHDFQQWFDVTAALDLFRRPPPAEDDEVE